MLSSSYAESRATSQFINLITMIFYYKLKYENKKRQIILKAKNLTDAIPEVNKILLRAGTSKSLNAFSSIAIK